MTSTPVSLFIDGWMIQGEIVPSPEDHATPFEDRFTEFCGRPEERYIASQNVAQLYYRITKPGSGFKVSYRARKVKHPCNAVAMNSNGEHSLSNYGNQGNCTFSILYSSRIFIHDVDIGVHDGNDYNTCIQGNDYAQFLKTSVLTSADTQIVTEMCGKSGFKVNAKGDMEMKWSTRCDAGQAVLPSTYESNGGPPADIKRSLDEAFLEAISEPSTAQCSHVAQMNVPLNCLHSVVRLVSSGNYDNHISFKYVRYEGKEDGECFS
ncbi:corticotropin-releasing factor-binding protein-like [Saccoglossus kowalevskii]|uniref:Corticotropin-releasing factor-binding protein-like n=1 Tax=Saccoglossus kowalevskii TaxID=10224 RepID=A0ABM0LWC1_SACKO|nr:PREDICTED: corticotropin-releasing factor-binding protein-like [Saccoglossus kowalevskii]